MLQDINSITDVEAVINEIEAAVNAPGTDGDLEETIYSLEDLHPEGDFEAEIIVAKEVKNFIVIEFETSEGEIAKFYPVTNAKIDQRLRYLLKAVGVPTKGFTLSSLVAKIVNITVSHYVSEKDGETRASVASIQ
jgi:hypothetical protein